MVRRSLQQRTSRTARFNLVTVGRTGAGKSALVNYILGKNVSKTGVGAPVTKPESGLDCFEGVVGELPILVCDTKGLEVLERDHWLTTLKNELERRNAVTPVENWFHLLFYCINAASTRVEQFDVLVLNAFRAHKQPVVVVLTKADLVSPNAGRTLRREITKHFGSEFPVIEVCSEPSKTRTGPPSERFGRDEVQEQIVRGFWHSICRRLPDQITKGVCDQIDTKIDSLIAGIRHVSVRNPRQFAEGITQIHDDLCAFQKDLRPILRDVLRATVDDALRVYGTFKDGLRLPDLDEFPPLGKTAPAAYQNPWKRWVYQWATNHSRGIGGWLKRPLKWLTNLALLNVNPLPQEIIQFERGLEQARTELKRSVFDKRAQIEQILVRLISGWQVPGNGCNELDWSDELNERRIELIDRDIQGNITKQQRVELAELQRKAVAYRDLVAPLPIEGARRLHQHLVAVKRRREGR
jgi:GTP-binding protein EngB required for normal cell division